MSRPMAGRIPPQLVRMSSAAFPCWWTHRSTTAAMASICSPRARGKVTSSQRPLTRPAVPNDEDDGSNNDQRTGGVVGDGSGPVAECQEAQRSGHATQRIHDAHKVKRPVQIHRRESEQRHEPGGNRGGDSEAGPDSMLVLFCPTPVPGSPVGSCPRRGATHGFAPICCLDQGTSPRALRRARSWTPCPPSWTRR